MLLHVAKLEYEKETYYEIIKNQKRSKLPSLGPVYLVSLAKSLATQRGSPQVYKQQTKHIVLPVLDMHAEMI